MRQVCPLDFVIRWWCRPTPLPCVSQPWMVTPLTLIPFLLIFSSMTNCLSPPNAWYPVLRMWSVGVWKGCSPSFHCLSWFVLLNWEKTRIACNFPFKKRTESVGLSVLSVCFFMLSSLSVYRHFSGYKLCCLYTVCVYRLKEDSLKIGIFPAWIAAIM